jgi:hypothetical protein
VFLPQSTCDHQEKYSKFQFFRATFNNRKSEEAFVITAAKDIGFFTHTYRIGHHPPPTALADRMHWPHEHIHITLITTSWNSSIHKTLYKFRGEFARNTEV